MNSRRLAAARCRLLLLLALTTALALSACDLTPPQPPGGPTPEATNTQLPYTPAPDTPVPTETPVPSAHPFGGTITARIANDPASLNPWLAGTDQASAIFAGLVYGGLTRLDDHLEPQPDLADHWTPSQDGLAISFHLRPGVTWQDGQPFTTADVIWSYKMIAALPPATAAIVEIHDAVKSVDVDPQDPASVLFTLNRRDSPLLSDLAMPILPSHILSGTALEKLPANPYNRAPIGTGPFSFAARTPGASILLKANPDYYGGRPFVDNAALLVAPNDDVAAKAVETGSLMLAQLSANSAEALVKAGNGVRGGAYDELGYDFVAFNLRASHPFSDTRLRQAFAYALDKQGMAYRVTGGGADPVWSDTNKASWAYNPDVPKYGGDPAKAKQLLAAAGWTDTNGDGIVDKNKKPLQISLYVRTDNEVRIRAAHAMIAPLRAVGIGATVVPLDFQTALQARLSATTNPPFDFDVMLLGFSKDNSDPDSFALFHTSQIRSASAPGLLNFTGFSALEYDSLSLDARSTYDFAQRRTLYSRIQYILADQLPYYYLWSQKYGVVAGPKLHGDIDFNSPMYLWNIKDWWIQ